MHGPLRSTGYSAGGGLARIVLGLATFFLATGGIAGVLFSSVGTGLRWGGDLGTGEVGSETSTRTISRLYYPATVLREVPQPFDGEWLVPAGALDLNGDVFVLDTGNDRILRLDDAGSVVATLDGDWDERLGLQQPMALAGDGAHLYVANSLSSEIVVLDPSRGVDSAIPLQPTAAGAVAPRPIGLMVTEGGNIVVSDADNHRVLLLDRDGKVVATAGTGARASGPDGFNVPGAVTADGAGNLYVVDTLNGRVVKLSPEGAFIRQFGELGDTADRLSRPKGVAVDDAGRVFISDGLQAAVKVFSPEGEYLGAIALRDPADPASGPLFRAPAGLWLSSDVLYVTDRVAGLLVLKLGDPTQPEPTEAE